MVDPLLKAPENETVQGERWPASPEVNDDVNDASCRLRRLRARGRLPDRVSERTRQLVRWPQQALVQSTELDLRAGLDGNLSSRCHRRVADMGTKSSGNGDAVVADPDGAQFPLVACFLFGAFAWRRVRNRPVAIRSDPGIHRVAVGFRSHFLGDFRALCRLGRLCVPAEFFNRSPELSEKLE